MLRRLLVLAAAFLVPFAAGAAGVDDARCDTASGHRIAATSKSRIADPERYPQMSGAAGGWMYLDLDRTKGDDRVTQNWIVTNMNQSGYFPTVAADAAALGNGCSAPTGYSEVTVGSVIIGPARKTNP